MCVKPIAYMIMGSILLTLLSCAPLTNVLPVTETTKPPAWIMESLENPACLPPCWENITPGISEITDARNLQIKYPNVLFDVKRGTSLVRLISLNLLKYDSLPSEILISTYGQPNYIRIYKCDPNARCETHLIYKDIGVVLNTYPDNSGNVIEPLVTVYPSTYVLKIYFLEIGLYSYYQNFGGDATQMIPWNGFGNYSVP